MMAKLDTLESFIVKTQALKNQGKRVGLAVGIFDLIDSGQVRFLETSKLACDFLLVAIRSDYGAILHSSVEPIHSQAERADIVSGMWAVDGVFLCDGESQSELESLIKPEEVFVENSTNATRLRERISTLLKKETRHFQESAPILFLDRDGTIIEHVEYIHEPSKVKIIPGAIESMKRFQNAGFRIAIVTNQPGINLGYFKKEDFFAVNKVILKECKASGVHIDKIYYSSNPSFENASWRKPNPGMIEAGLHDLNGIREKSVMIGDSDIDVEAGRAARIGRVVLLAKNKVNESVEIASSLREVFPL